MKLLTRTMTLKTTHSLLAVIFDAVEKYSFARIDEAHRVFYSVSEMAGHRVVIDVFFVDRLYTAVGASCRGAVAPLNLFTWRRIS